MPTKASDKHFPVTREREREICYDKKFLICVLDVCVVIYRDNGMHSSTWKGRHCCLHYVNETISECNDEEYAMGSASRFHEECFVKFYFELLILNFFRVIIKIE